jgi:outer membrane protein OmpA-like peptidoglycan-associated protein
MNALGQVRRLALALAALCAAFGAASAQQPTEEDIKRALMRRPLGGGQTLNAPGPPHLGGVRVDPGSEPAAPSIDLYINFEYNSADLEPEALMVLRSLGNALRSPELNDARIMIIGHTDARGSDEYNLRLSQRRAQAVRKLLVGVYDIEPGRLQAVGRGKRELKDQSRPDDAINRRVEIRNVSESAATN